METKALEKSWENLPPTSRLILKLILFVGTLSLAWKMGFFSLAGFITVSSVLAVCAMIFFGLTQTETETRAAFHDHYYEIKKWFIATLAEIAKDEEASKKDKKVV